MATRLRSYDTIYTNPEHHASNHVSLDMRAAMASRRSAACGRLSLSFSMARKSSAQSINGVVPHASASVFPNPPHCCRLPSTQTVQYALPSAFTNTSVMRPGTCSSHTDSGLIPINAVCATSFSRCHVIASCWLLLRDAFVRRDRLRQSSRCMGIICLRCLRTLFRRGFHRMFFPLRATIGICCQRMGILGIEPRIVGIEPRRRHRLLTQARP